MNNHEESVKCLYAFLYKQDDKIGIFHMFVC